ncbi:MAG: aspartate aminotransferase family protein [Deltaproteobacteria bacterium]|nr:aspartate aminotransferase family protein [Deltaproteobacteria bacterium]
MPAPDPGSITEELALERRRRAADGPGLWRQYVNPSWAGLLRATGWERRFVRAQGLELEDDRGERYLDFLSGFGVLGLGHNHPAIKAALRAALDDDLPGFTQVECSALAGLAAERLSALLPGGPHRVFFCSSGSEAVEAAIKLARAATGKRRLVACEGAYHGSTLGALSLKGIGAARDRFGPLLPEVLRIPFGDLEALQRAARGGDLAAFVVEPILGEGGTVVPPADFLPRAADAVHAQGGLLVVDEVQTGLGRTGRMFAFEHAGASPDVVTVAKVLGGGLVPVGAMAARAEAFDRAYGSARTCMDHATTFGGGPLAMVAVLATLRVLEEERLVERADEQGRTLRRKLEDIAARRSSIREVRGMGLMLGLKFKDAAGGWLDRTPLAAFGQASAALLAQYVALRLLSEHRIVTQAAVNDPSVLKVMPPLTVDGPAIDRFAAALDAVLADAGHASAFARFATEFVRHARG